MCLYHQTAVKMYEFTATVDRMKTLFIGICQARIGKYDVLSAVACVGLLRKVGRVVDCGGLENHCSFWNRGFESFTFRRPSGW